MSYVLPRSKIDTIVPRAGLMTNGSIPTPTLSQHRTSQTWTTKLPWKHFSPLGAVSRPLVGRGFLGAPTVLPESHRGEFLLRAMKGRCRPISRAQQLRIVVNLCSHGLSIVYLAIAEILPGELVWMERKDGPRVGNVALALILEIGINILRNLNCRALPLPGQSIQYFSLPFNVFSANLAIKWTIS